MSDTSELKSEHGLSIWVEADDRRILFDTGQSDILIHNTKRLGIDLASADTCAYLHDRNVNRIVPCHCTGEKAVEYLRSRFNDRVQIGRVGSNVILG